MLYQLDYNHIFMFGVQVVDTCCRGFLHHLMTGQVLDALRVFDKMDDLSMNLNQLIDKASLEALQANRTFTIALSGGSLAKQLALAKFPHTTHHWKVLFADERCVPVTHPDSNCGLFTDLFKAWGIKPEQVLMIEHEDQPSLAAQAYAKALEQVLDPVLDVCLLGMGPDGHTCSLFPGHALLEETSLVGWLTDSPKPPPSRITLTYPVINASRHCVFVAVGQGKADALHQMIDLNVDLPAARVRPTQGQLLWFVDRPAISKLNQSIP